MNLFRLLLLRSAPLNRL